MSWPHLNILAPICLTGKHYNINDTVTEPGHGFELHVLSSRPFPGHSAPPPWGTGLLQERARVCVPPPQLTLQVDQPFQLPHPPLTTMSHTHIKLHYVGLYRIYLDTFFWVPFVNIMKNVFCLVHMFISRLNDQTPRQYITPIRAQSIPRHSLLHFSSWRNVPWQTLPPFFGTIHIRDLDLLPTHDKEHEDHLPHGFQ